MSKKPSSKTLLEDRYITWFRNAKDSSPDHNATLEETFDRIAHKPCPIQVKVRAIQQQILAAKANGTNGAVLKDLEKRKTRIKESAPGFSLSGTFKGRRSNETMVEHSGVIQGDFDHVPEEEMDLLIDQLKQSEHVWKIWRSISGDGLKAAVLIPRDKDLHRSSFASVQIHLKQITGRSIDEQCKDPARICFISYDPDLWTNDSAVPIDLDKAGTTTSAKPQTIEPIRDTDHLKAQIRAIAESLVGPLGEWKVDEKNRVYAFCRCPDVSRDHHFEDEPNTRVYLNPGRIPWIECRHGECAAVVRKRNEMMRREFLEKGVGQDWPDIVDAYGWLTSPIVLPMDVVEKVLHVGDKMVLGGGAKSFKTWQQLDLAISVASGTPWLGFNSRAGKVLYLNLELPTSFCWKRIQDVCSAKGVTFPEDRLHVWNLRGCAADIDIVIPKILTRIEETAYCLIVIDPIYKLLGSKRDENKAGDIATLLNALEHLAVQANSAVIFGAHYSKGNQATKESIDRISGSGVFGRDPDVILNFTRHEVPDAFAVESILRNHAPIAPFSVRWKYPIMELAPDLDPTLLKQITTGGKRKSYSVSEWISLVPDDTNIGYNELLALIINSIHCSRSTAKTMVTEALEEKLIVHCKRTKDYKKGTGF